MSLLHLIACATVTAGSQQSWIGVPDPDFGGVIGNPINVSQPSWPGDWSSEVAGYYYVNYQTGTNTGRTYGTPTAPRQTIPISLAAGALVVVEDIYSSTHTSGNAIVATGTANSPVWIVGNPSNPPYCRNQIDFDGCTYLMVDGLNTASANRSDTQDIGIHIVPPSSYVCVRNSSVQGNDSYGGLSLGGSGGDNSYIVFYNNDVSWNGDWDATWDQDRHGTLFSYPNYYVWILNSVYSYNSGDGIQIGDQASNIEEMHHIFIAGNEFHHNRQTGVWAKQCNNVVVSQNTFHDFVPAYGGFSNGQSCGGQYDHYNIWYIFNHIYDCTRGIQFSHTTSTSNYHRYLIGNVIHDVDTGIDVWGYNPVHVINNLVDDVTGTGIRNDGTNYGAVDVIGNMVGDCGSYQVWFSSSYSSVATASAFDYNMFKGTSATLSWGDGVTRNVAGIQSTFSKCLNAFESASLGVTDEANSNYSLTSGSNAIDTGTEDSVYGTFYTLYGVSIKKDYTGGDRPATGSDWDIGPYEYGV